jgi:hypothetical protein
MGSLKVGLDEESVNVMQGMHNIKISSDGCVISATYCTRVV